MTKNSKEIKNICTATMNVNIQNIHVLYSHFNVLFATMEYKKTVFLVKIILSPKYAPVDTKSERLLRSRNIFYFLNNVGIFC